MDVWGFNMASTSAPLPNILIVDDRKENLLVTEKVLQDRALGLFADSLRHGGFLCLGNKESLSFSAVAKLFEPVDAQQRIFRKL